MNVLMVYPEFPDTFWSFKHALNFIRRKAANPPLGLITVAAMLPPQWTKRVVDMNVRHLSEEEIDWADMVMVSAMIVQRESAKKLIARCKASGKTVVAGGPLFTGEYEDFPEVDHFILNEAEITLAPFLADLEKGTPRRVYSTEEYADIQQSPLPMWELLDLSGYDCLSIQFTRGCPFNCDFCNVTALLGHQVRYKTVAQIINELNTMYALGWRRGVFFVDDNFIGNKKFLKQDLLPALIEWRKGKIGFSHLTEVSINLADDEELVRMMVAAGFVSVFVGIETPAEEGLTECHKSQNRNRDLTESVRYLQRSGLQVMAGFIVGFDTDTPGIFQRQIDFIQKAGIVTAMVGLLQAPYGTRLYHRLEAEGRLVQEMSGDNTDGSTNIIPTMEIQTLKAGYQHILKEIYSPRLFYERVLNFLKVYKPGTEVRPIELQEVLALFRSIWHIGILGPARREYWNLFFWALFNDPPKFPLAITMSIYGFHFRKVSELSA
jgi:radical SAM superfamily enzyme YgiQ (UPF0313 family)